MRKSDEEQIRDSQFRSFLRRMPEGYTFSAEDRAALRTLARYLKVFPNGHIFKYFGEPKPDTVLILDGVAARVRITEKGSRRILGFVLAGELSIAPPSAEYANYELVTQGTCLAVTLPWHELKTLERNHGNIRRFLRWHAQEEIRVLENKFVAMSGAQVEEKLMYVLKDIYSRLQKVDKVYSGRVKLPLKQRDLADAVGASVVQVSKTLSKMRREGRLDLQFAPAQTTVSLSPWRHSHNPGCENF